MELSPPLEALDLITEVVGDLLGGEGGLSEHGGGLLVLLGGDVGPHVGGASPPLLGSVGGVERVEIQTSLQSHTSHRAPSQLRVFNYVI